MNAIIVLAVAALVAVALGVYLLAAARRRPVAVAASAPFGEDDGIVSEPVPIERRAAHPLERPPAFEPPPVLGDFTGPALDEPALGAVEVLPERTVAEDARDVEAQSAAEAQPVAEPQSTAPAAPAAEMCWAKRFAPRSGALGDSARLGLIRDLGLVRAPWGVPLLVEAYDEEPDAAHRRAVLAALALYRHLDARAVFERALRSDDEGERAIAGAALADLGVTPSLSS
ncbi:MAG: hypothetical protein QOI11_1991 [Candidatus Eremiobacteraeota bacterium]|jgi:hypothetical protein|nr:hypothetical protein [Candidatus Eremiobacteraeota bacterium]